MSKMRGTACYVRQVQDSIPRRGTLAVMSCYVQDADCRILCPRCVVQHAMSDRYRMVFQDAELWLLCLRRREMDFVFKIA